VLTGGYWDTFLALPLLSGAPAGRLAVLGNAAGTVARAYGTAWPQTHVDGVELDPLVTQVGRRYFGEGRLPMLTVHTDDARPYLAHTSTRYDEIVVDAYRQPYIPFYLTTKEFFTLVRDRLTPSGVVAINVGTPPDEQQVVGRIAATMRAVFGQVWSARWDRFTSIVIGLQRPEDPRPRLRAATGLPRAASRALARELRPVPPDPGAVLTDDHAPIEWLTDRAILAYLREGAPGANP
jgi:hypothetical protein